MMKIYLDNIIFSLQKAGGISIYWYEHLKRILQEDGIQLKMIETSGSQNIFRQKISFDDKYTLNDWQIPMPVLRYLPLQKKLDAPSVFHTSYYRPCFRKNVKNIVTVYDFIYESYTYGLKKRVHLMQKKWAVRNADGLICISENTKKDLLMHNPGLDESNIKVIYVGVSDEFHPVERNREADKILGNNNLEVKKYVLFIGSRAPYKNFDLAVEALLDFPGYKLVVVGGGPLTEAETSMLNASFKDRFLEIQGLSSQQINLLYNFAHCLIYPSSYEGFGIPVAEAMKAGCPVIAMNTSSIPEVAGNAGLLINGKSVVEAAENLRKLENEAFRSKKIEEGISQSAKFSWDQCYLETMAFYKQIMAG